MHVDSARDPAARLCADVTHAKWLAKVANAELGAIALLMASENVDREVEQTFL
jgi:hypothetical protein